MNYSAFPFVGNISHTLRRAAVGWLRLVLLLTCVLPLNPAHALDLHQSVSQYGHATWRTEDGALPGVPHAIAQTTDGYLWIGTEAGLMRFDGVRFVHWQSSAGEHLCDCNIMSLLGTHDGALWIGTGRSLYRLKDGILKKYPVRWQINDIVEDQDGAVWIGMSRFNDLTITPLCHVADSATACYGKKDGIPVGKEGIETLVQDGSGGLWLGSVHGVLHWTPSATSTYFPSILDNASGATGVLALDRQSDGSVLVGMGQGGKHLGLQKLSDGAWTDFPIPGGNGADWEISAIRNDHSGGLWIGTVKDGIYHVHNQRVDHYSQRDGLTSNSVEAMFEDHEGNIWIASSLGLDRFRDLPVNSLSSLQGLSGDHATSVLSTQEGGIWVANGRSLDYLKDDKRIFSLTEKDLHGKQLTAIFVDHTGRLWYGVDTNLAIWESGHSHFVSKPDGSPIGVVVAIVEDGENNIWAVVTGQPQTLLRIQDLKVTESVAIPYGAFGSAVAADAREGVWIGSVFGVLQRYSAKKFATVATRKEPSTFGTILMEPDGSLWAGSAKGLVRWQNNSMQVMDMRNGLPCDRILSVIKDNAGMLWLHATCGLISISASELKKWQEHPDAPVAFHVFDLFEGYLAGESPFSPTATKAPDGRLWFVNDKILQSIDPTHLPENRLAPPVHIEAMRADRKTYPMTDGLQLPALTKDIEFDYTALSYVVPQKVRFQYLLEGQDSTWQEPGTRRQAFYNDLRPGNYRFRVIASNNDGVWNETGAGLSFKIAPAYYQTTWFYLLVACAVGVILYIAYQIRVRQIAAALTVRFDERTAERSRLAAELHDTLLQSIQATKLIADNARHSGTQEPAELEQTIVNISDWLAQATTEARAALNDLRLSTTEKNDLAKAFQRTAESVGVTTAMKFILSVQGTPRDLHPIVRDEIYRIGGEAIRNAYRHSQATELEVTLIYDQGLTIRIADNGIGMEGGVDGAGKPGHFGLLGMQERACRIHAKLTMTSRLNSGTEVSLLVPGKVVFQEENHDRWHRLLAGLNRLFSRKRRAKDQGKEER